MRNRRRDRRHYHNTDKILFIEFEYYNKKKKIVSQKILKETKLKFEKLINDYKYLHWTTKQLAKQNISFELTQSATDKDIYITLHQHDKKFNFEDLNKCRSFIKNSFLLTCDLTEDQESFIDKLSISKNYYNTEKNYIVVNSFNELFNKLIEDDQMNSDDFYFDCDTKLLNDIFDINLKKINTERVGHCYYLNILHINAVYETRINNKNYRIAFMQYTGYTNNMMIKIIPDTSEDYIYIDEGRVCFFRNNGSMFFIDDSLKEYTSDGILKLYVNVIKHIYDNIGNLLKLGEKVITPFIYRFYKDRIGYIEDNNITDTTEIKIIEKYKKLLNEDKEIKLEHCKISNNKIEVIGENFKLEYNSNFLDTIKKFGNIRAFTKDENVKYNFNLFYEKILNLSVLKVVKKENTRDRDYKEFKETTFTLNNMKIEVCKDDNNRIRINNIFCRIDDIFFILSKAICYTNLEDYNKYIKDVSFIGIEWTKMISQGIQLELKNPFKIITKEDENMLMRFTLSWDKDKRRNVYLLLNEQKYLIKNKVKFKKYFNMPKRVLSMSNLKKELSDCIENLDNHMIMEITDNAVEEAKIVKERGKKLVKETIEMIGAKETTVNMAGHDEHGYTFLGAKTKSKFFIRIHDLSVFKYDSGHWNRRCIVDSHQKQRIFEDKLANRLINVYNEPAYIYNYLH